MTKTKIRGMAVLLALLMLSAGSCASSGEESDTSALADDSGETAPSAPVLPGPELPEGGFDGATFTIYTRYHSEKSFVLPESTGDVLDDAIYKRIIDTEEALNVNIENVNGAGDEYGTQAQNTILAGDDSYQMICGHARMMFTYAQTALVHDWNDLPYIDFSNEWWDPNMVEGLSIGGKLYVAADDLTHNALANTKALLFNKTLFDEYDMEYPYKDVLDMKWTLDRFTEVSTAFSKDLNGDSQLKPEDDRFGFGTSIWGAPINILWNAGLRICDTTGEEGRLELTLNTPRTVSVFEDFFGLLGAESSFLASATEPFKSGRLAFASWSLDGLVSARDMDDDIGIVPFPMYDEAQGRYYTGVDASCNGLSVPITVQDTDMASSVIEYMCYLYYRDILPVYYDTVLKTKSSRDDESQAMIDLIRESRLYDIGYFYNGLLMNSVGAELALMNEPNFASYYAQNESAAKATLDEVNAYFFEK